MNDAKYIQPDLPEQEVPTEGDLRACVMGVRGGVQQYLDTAQLREEQRADAIRHGFHFHIRRPSPEGVSRYFESKRLGSDMESWFLRAFADEEALPQLPHLWDHSNNGHNSPHPLQGIVIDPQRVPYLLLANLSGSSDKKRDPKQRLAFVSGHIDTMRTWFMYGFKPFITGRIVFADDGMVGVFQQQRKSIVGASKKLLPHSRASFALHDSVYEALASQMYAIGQVERDENIVRSVRAGLSELLMSYQARLKNGDQEALDALVLDVKEKFGDRRTWFTARKIIHDYLDRLEGKHYDHARITAAMDQLLIGKEERAGIVHTIKFQSEVLYDEKNDETLRWKSLFTPTLYAQDWKVSGIFHSLETDFPGFLQRIQRFVGSKKPQFRPFSSFHDQWQEFLSSHKDPTSARRLFAIQCSIYMLYEFKLRHLTKPKQKSPKLTLEDRKKCVRLLGVFQTLDAKVPEIAESVVSIDPDTDFEQLNEQVKNAIHSLQSITLGSQ